MFKHSLSSLSEVIPSVRNTFFSSAHPNGLTVLYLAPRVLLLPALGLASVVQTNHTPLDGSYCSHVPALSKFMGGDFPPAAPCQVQKPPKIKILWGKQERIPMSQSCCKGEVAWSTPTYRMRVKADRFLIGWSCWFQHYANFLACIISFNTLLF